MQVPRLLTAIDVGTTKVCTIVARQTGPSEFEVLGHSTVPCGGLRKGNVVDEALTQQSIRASIDQVEERAEIAVRSAFVGVAGSHVSYENLWHPIDWAGEHGVITGDDLARIPSAVAAASNGNGRTVLHALPMAFSVDGKRGIKDPLGMHTSDLEVKSHVVTGAPSAISTLVETVHSAGIEVDGLVLEPLASSEAVLTVEDKQQGAVVVDIGGGTTDIVVFRSGNVCYTSVVPVGGFQLTNDICHTYNTPFQDAEAVKLQYGHTEPQTARMADEVLLPVEGRDTQLKVPHRDICQIIRERAQELVRLIKLKLEEAQVEDIAATRLVLTGGSSNLPGLEDLVRKTLTNGVRMGMPNGGSNIPDELAAPEYSTAVGMLLWAARQPDPDKGHNGNGRKADEQDTVLISRLLSQVRSLPEELISSIQGRKA